jgi:hypothetical protein
MVLTATGHDAQAPASKTPPAALARAGALWVATSAAARSLASLTISRRGRIVAVLWVTAGAVVAAFFSDRVPLIIDVVLRRRL